MTDRSTLKVIQHSSDRSSSGFLFLSSLIVTLSIGLSACALFKPAKVEEVKQPPYVALPNMLGSEYFHSPTGDIAGRYPTGWLLVNTEREAELDDLLFVYTDRERTRAIVLTEIAGTAEVRRGVERDGVSALAEASFMSKSIKRPGMLEMTRKPEVYTVNGNLYATYEYTSVRDAGAVQRTNRVVVFTTGSRFYELAMIELVAPTTADQHAENFRILESVIGTLEGVAQLGS